MMRNNQHINKEKNINKKKAAALQYDSVQKEGAPRLIAVGEGYLAEKIIELAQKGNIPLVEDTEIVNKLVQLPVGVEIPRELYEAVARILIYIYKLDRESRP
jgi:flagellar biosynthesis protein